MYCWKMSREEEDGVSEQLPAVSDLQHADDDQWTFADADGSSDSEGPAAPTPSVVENNASVFLQDNVANVSSLDSGDAATSWQSLVSASAFNRPSAALKQPWEKGIFSQIFGQNKKPKLFHSILDCPNQACALPVPSQVRQATESEGRLEDKANAARLDQPGVWSIVAHRISSIQWIDKDQIMRSRSLEWLRLLVVENLEGSKLGRSLLSDILSLQTDNAVVNSITDVFRHKSTRTLYKRGKTVLKYLLFCRAHQYSPLPVLESVAYAFMLSFASTSPSTAQQVREMFNFLHGLVGADGAADAAASPRICGLANKGLLQKRPLKQAEVLRVSEVIALERLLADDSLDLTDRVFAGHLLMILFGRMRWSDGLHLCSMELDVDEFGDGFLQTSTLTSKTSSTVRKKRTFLPFTILANGISEQRWATIWLNLRSASNLTPHTSERFGETPTMCQITFDGSFSRMPMDAADASLWMRELLIRTGTSGARAKQLSSHSLKATTLSWCAKFGVAKLDRDILGYHMSPQASSAGLHYSRDEQSGPLRKLISVVEAIRSGEFNPDSTRSGYFRRQKSCREEADVPTPVGPSSQPVQDDHAELLHEVNLRDYELGIFTEPLVGSQQPVPTSVGSAVSPGVENGEVVSSSTSSSEDSDSSDQLETSLRKQTDNERPSARAPASASSSNGQQYVHKRYRTLHASSDSSGKLACGRQLHEGYDVYDGLSFVSRCGQCFGTG